jgi:hypothetical protein
LSSSIANISDPRRNYVPHMNFTSKVQVAMSPPGQILSASPFLTFLCQRVSTDIGIRNRDNVMIT